MNLDLVEKVANAVLYEGYMLYPYTASSVKNQQRWNFGVLSPPAYDISEMQTECLVTGDATVHARVRFLQVMGAETAERRLEISNISLAVPQSNIDIQGAVPFRVSAVLTGVSANLSRLKLRITNLSPVQPDTREEALTHSMLSTHTILTATNGEFISLIDPAAEYREAAAACRNIGTFPVLAGAEGERQCMLSSPIILYDYPQVAPESPGDLFDALEIDEILTLRILTLSDEEKAQIRDGDERTRQVLERSESMPPEHLMKLHGAVRGLRPVQKPEEAPR